MIYVAMGILPGAAANQVDERLPGATKVHLAQIGFAQVGTVEVDLFIVPMVGFKLLHCLVVLGQGRRRLLHHATTAHPAAEWITRQIVEASPGIKRPSSRCEIGMPSIAPSWECQFKRQELCDWG
jgi:hypothetical protein